MSPEDNKAIIRTYVETIWNQRQLDRAGELVAPDFADHGALPGQAPGLAGAKQKWAMFLTGIPDLHVTIEDLVAEGDKVAARHAGPVQDPYTTPVDANGLLDVVGAALCGCCTSMMNAFTCSSCRQPLDVTRVSDVQLALKYPVLLAGFFR